MTENTCNDDPRCKWPGDDSNDWGWVPPTYIFITGLLLALCIAHFCMVNCSNNLCHIYVVQFYEFCLAGDSTLSAMLNHGRLFLITSKMAVVRKEPDLDSEIVATFTSGEYIRIDRYEKKRGHVFWPVDGWIRYNSESVRTIVGLLLSIKTKKGFTVAVDVQDLGTE